MNFKKYLTKLVLKEFLLCIILDFVFITSFFLLMTVILTGEIPSDYMVWLSLIVAYSVGDSIRHVYQLDKLENVSELTKGNYWKLKNELKRKVDKRGRNGDR